jgi:hypothetical protein
MSRQVAIAPGTRSAAVLVEDAGTLHSSPRRAAKRITLAELEIGTAENTGVFPRLSRAPRFVGAPTLSPLRI